MRAFDASALRAPVVAAADPLERQCQQALQRLAGSTRRRVQPSTTEEYVP